MYKSFLNVAQDAIAPENAFFHVLPIPLALGDKRARLAANAPEAILDASAFLSPIDMRSKRSVLRLGVYTHPAIRVENVDALADEIERIDAKYELFSPKRFPVALGGSCEISDAFMRLAAKRFRELSFVRMGARANLRNATTAFAPTLVGVRGCTQEEYAAAPEVIDSAISCDAILDDFERVVEHILWKCEQNVYLTIDVNLFDPSVVPGACYPEPDGLPWRRALELIEAIALGKCVVGVDIVGLAPLGGDNIVSEYAAAKLVARLIDVVGQKKGAWR